MPLLDPLLHLRHISEHEFPLQDAICRPTHAGVQHVAEEFHCTICAFQAKCGFHCHQPRFLVNLSFTSLCFQVSVASEHRLSDETTELNSRGPPSLHI